MTAVVHVRVTVWGSGLEWARCDLEDAPRWTAPLVEMRPKSATVVTCIRCLCARKDP